MTKRQNGNKTKEQSNEIKDKIKMKNQLKNDNNNMSQETGILEYLLVSLLHIKLKN